MTIQEQLRQTEHYADEFNFRSNGVLFTKGDHTVDVTADLRHAVLGASEYCGTAADRIDELEGVLESNAKVLKTGLQTSIKNMHLHDALKSSHELLCILRTMVESCDKEINPDWTYEQLGQNVYNLLLSQEVYEDLHVENERALVIQDSATNGG